MNSTYIIKNKDGLDRQILLREIKIDDYNKNYLYLLKQLTCIDPNKISIQDFKKFVDKLNDNHRIIVIENTEDNIIIGSGTLLIEQKIIHDMGKVGHIEDVVIDNEYRGQNLGKQIINTLINLAKDYGCYKIILNCDIYNIEFYQKCGFIKKEIQMVKYLR